jgi:hypothetical protein
MTTTLRISKDLTLPIDVASQAVSIFGIRGSGKTNTAGVIAEELLTQGQPVVIIDPTDAWWGLRTGFPILIFGGSHGDLPLQETDGKTIAEFQVQERVPFILSLRHLRKGAQRRFVTEFCEELYHLKGSTANRAPLTVFIDEAPLFVPQKVLGEVARMVGAVEDLIARGRNAGFGVVLISQRCATLNADVRTQCDTIISHRLTAKLDRDAIKGWFEENASVDGLKGILESLATLKNGEGWVWSPSIDVMARTRMRLRSTFDSSATPKPGEKVKAPNRLKDVDLQALKGKLATAIEQARATDPKELQKRIRELEQQLSAKPQVATAVVDEAAVQRAVAARDHFWTGEWKRRTRILREGVDKCRSRLSAAQEDLASALGEILEVPTDRPASTAPVHNSAHNPHSNRQASLQPPKPKANAAAVQSGDLQPAHQRILDALAWLASFGLVSPERSSVAAIAGASPKSSAFSNNVSRLSSLGLVTYPVQGRLSLTDSGRAAANETDRPHDVREIHDAWRNCPAFDPAHVRILNALIEAYPAALSRDELAQRAGASAASSAFSNNVSRLSSIGVAEYPDKGMVRARQATLFPGGLA